jgi:chromosome segregation ATPase
MVMKVQQFNKKELELLEIDKLFKQSFIKIRLQNKELRAKLAEMNQLLFPSEQINELQAKIANITQPFNQHNKELQAKLAEMNQPFKQINELQAKIANITQPFSQYNEELQAKLAKINEPLKRINEFQSKMAQRLNKTHNK